MKLLIKLFLIVLTLSNFSLANDFCTNKNLGTHAILQNGRAKPLIVHATETLKFLTGKSKFKNLSAVEAYCQLSISLFYPPRKELIYPLIEHVKVKELLGLNNERKEPFTFNELAEYRQDLMLERSKAVEGGSFYKALNRTLRKLNIYNSITNGTNWMVPAVESKNMEDIEPLVNLLTVLPKEPVNQSLDILKKELEKRQDQYQKAYTPKVSVEYIYAKAKLPMIAMVLTIITIALMASMKSLTLPLVFLFLTISIETILLILRVYISGRAPVTNMYETVLFSGYAGLIMAAVIGHFKKEKMFLYIGLGYNLLSIFMLNFSGGMLSASIGPLVPVLRDNFWLSTHVTSIIASYGALALSWVLANIVLVKNLFNPVASKELNEYSEIMYTCLKYGVTLLAGGIILGGVWADYSWGRFWGWDPKETWSLIVLLIYIVILHGRYTSWINNKKFVPYTAFAFLSVMMAWFGVNYILASGLHSYGFSEGGAIFLGSFFLVQMVILLITTPKLLHKKRAA